MLLGILIGINLGIVVACVILGDYSYSLTMAYMKTIVEKLERGC